MLRGVPVRFLFVKDTLAWPRSSGHDVHSYYMMRALTQLGHEVSLLTAAEPAQDAVRGLALTKQRTFIELEEFTREVLPPSTLSPLQERFRSYWGVSRHRIQAVADLARDFRADAVIVVGLEVLP